MYRLEAVLDDRVETIHIKDTLTEDEATMEAMWAIMDEAYEDNSGPWALGAITLTDSEGNVLQSMDAK